MKIFTKFNAILNNYNKNKELILWEHTNTVIYVSNKKDPISVEYFIWTIDSIIARSRLSKHYFIDATFHHPKDYEEFIIIIFKDTVVHEYFPCFYILVNNKSEVMYDLVFKSIKRILTQNYIYNLEVKTITTDTELALVNAVNNNFPNAQRIGCWFHLKQDLIRNARIFGLMNKKNKDADINLTYEIIKQLAILPLEYSGSIDYIKEKVNILMLQYPKYYNLLFNYFLENKIKYFKDGSYNYNKFPKDIRSNSILERYNKL